MLILAVLVLLFAVPSTRDGIRRGANFVGVEILRVSNSVGGWFLEIGTTFRSKTALENENADLKAQLADNSSKILDYDALAAENTDLKSILGRSTTAHLTLAAVLANPWQSAYDTLVIDGGTNASLAVGQTVYAEGDMPIGTIETVAANSALVRLYSSPKETTDGDLYIANDTGTAHLDVTLTGRGGGNFETTVPRDLVVPDGALVFSKDINPRVIAVFQKVTSDARDPFQTLLLESPVNVAELNFVEVGQN